MKNSFKIRNFVKQDYDALTRLWANTGLSRPEREDKLEVIERTLKAGGKLLVMINDEGLLIGSSWITTDARRLYLHHFGILSEYQGKGYSKPLMDKSMQFAKSTGLQIKLEVHKTNRAAIALYDKYGFKYLGDYLVFIVREY